MEPRLTVTSLSKVTSPAMFQIVFHSAKNMRLAPCSTVASPLGSLLPSPVGDHILVRFYCTTFLDIVEHFSYKQFFFDYNGSCFIVVQ